MTLDRAVRRLVAPVSVSPLISLLALVALLFAVFAIHSEAMGHAMHTLVPASSPVAASAIIVEHHTPVTGMAAVMAAPVIAAISSGSRGGMLDCALLAMTCVLLLTLVVMVFLTRPPTRYRRLLDSGMVSNSWRTTAQPSQRPSLTLLSICRV
ncbi:hypothetical protein [Cryobacterium serini]|uniref:Uncharacterized protein n=1 Tax=Cryobacterium serini TaxID=1259201 RepID=A0A4R9BVZ1_9MICO|nr:hypothetical protein [Cryobacterium serini]TFD91350.1 hypothetical protein E3T51_01145 [Cryobacterium serini]